MAAIDKILVTSPSPAANTPLDLAISAVAARMAQRGAHPAKVVVLAPFGQLLQWLKQQWAQSQPDGFAPRFETTRTWAQALGHSGHVVALAGPATDDFRADAAMDTLTARSLLERAGLGAYQDELHPRLLQCAAALAPRAAAASPDSRMAWLAQQQQALAHAQAGQGATSDLLRYEAAVTQLALAWVAASSYPTDVLHTSLFSDAFDLLVILDGFQADPLTAALAQQFGDKAVHVPLASIAPHAKGANGANSANDADGAPSGIRVHQAQDFEEEALWSAACVLRHLADRETLPAVPLTAPPVALVANDRSLTRRIRAMLETQGVTVQDATGWTLSTTRAAANVMAALQAAAWNASSDAVLDWLKNAPAFSQTTVAALETVLRQTRCNTWRQRQAQTRPPTDERGPEVAPSLPSSTPAASDHPDHPAAAAMLALETQVNTLCQALQAPRSFSRWQGDVVAHLQACGLWQTLQGDAAGLAVVNALHWGEVAQTRLADWHLSQRRMRLDEYTAWVRSTLEASSYLPLADTDAQVMVLPLSQLLARPCFAIVMPGCDEIRLSASPELPGGWTPAERAALGLTSREEVAQALRVAWQQALLCPQVDILWRSADAGGEPLLPSPLVQSVPRIDPPDRHPLDNLAPRRLLPNPGLAPLPKGELLAVSKLSSSAYEDLRRCPYRFFAMRQLGLKEQNELEAELEKRDIGDWLHEVLKDFHQALPTLAPDTEATRRQLLDRCAQACRERRQFSDGDFLPYQAAWPGQRDAYLTWLVAHEANGARFERAETWHETGLGPVTLIGRLDRIDSTGPATGATGDDLADKPVIVLDYKTESPSTSKARVNNPMEDTQLAFYAALLPHDSLRAAYLNVNERDGTQLFEQHALVDARDALIEGILDDMQRIAGGAVLAALGEGQACEYCAARGLCRKDFWESA